MEFLKPSLEELLRFLGGSNIPFWRNRFLSQRKMMKWLFLSLSTYKWKWLFYLFYWKSKPLERNLNLWFEPPFIFAIWRTPSQREFPLVCFKSHLTSVLPTNLTFFKYLVNAKEGRTVDDYLTEQSKDEVSVCWWL